MEDHFSRMLDASATGRYCAKPTFSLFAHIIFPIQLTASRVGNRTRLIHTLLIVTTTSIELPIFFLLSVQFGFPIPEASQTTDAQRRILVGPW